MSFDSVAQGFFCPRDNFLHDVREVLPSERESEARDERMLKLFNGITLSATFGSARAVRRCG
jgi:hypothetical protein